MFSNFKERFNSAVQNLAESERMAQFKTSRTSILGGVKRTDTPIRMETESSLQELEDEFKPLPAVEPEKVDEEQPLVEEQEKTVIELPPDVVEKLDKLQRYESKFPDIIKGYKRLLKEKRAIEAVLKDTTPLEGLGDIDAFEAHLKSLIGRSEMAREEIKRIADEKSVLERDVATLRQQKEVQFRESSALVLHLETETKADRAKWKDMGYVAGQLSELLTGVEQEGMDAVAASVASPALERLAASLRRKEEEALRAQLTESQNDDADPLGTSKLKAEELQAQVKKLKEQLKKDPNVRKALVNYAEHLGIPHDDESVPALATALVASEGGCMVTSKLEEAETERDKHLQTIAELHQQGSNEGVQKDLNKANLRITVITNAMEGLKKQREELETECKALKKQLSKRKNNQTTTTHESEEHAEEVAELQGKITTLEGSIKQFENLLEQATDTQSALERQISTLEETRQGLVKQVATVSTERDALEAEKLDNLQQIEELEHTLQGWKQTEKALIKKAETLEARVTQLQDDVTAAKRMASEATDKTQKLVSALKAAQTDLKKVERELVEVNKKLSLSEATVKDYEEKLRIKATEQQASSIKFADLQMQLSQRQFALDKAEREMTAIIRDRDALSNRTSDLAKEKTAWKQEKQRLDELIRARKNDYDLQKSMLDTTARQLEEANTKLIQAEIQVKVFQEETTTSQRLFEEKAKEYEKLASLLHEAEQHAQSERIKYEKESSKYVERVDTLSQELNKFKLSSQQEQEEMQRQLMDARDALKRVQVELDGKTTALVASESAQETLMKQSEAARSRLAVVEESLAQFTEDNQRIKSKETELVDTITTYETTMEEMRTREAHIKALNKTLKEEVMKLHKQAERLKASTPTSQGSPTQTPRTLATPPPNEELVNLEYLRHIFVKFIEHKNQRVQLLSVIGTLLKISPQETKKLVNKVTLL